MSAPDTYIPGVCNIGPAERSKRNQIGWIGLAATAGLWLAFVWFDAAPVLRLLLFLPATTAAVGFLQAYMHFCAYFGFTALFNFGPLGRADTVEQAEFRRLDRQRAWRIVGYSAAIGAVVAALGYALA